MTKTVTFEVEEIDQRTEGGDVWAVTDECIDDVGLATDRAHETSKHTEYQFARVVRVTREVVTVFRNGEVHTAGKR